MRAPFVVSLLLSACGAAQSPPPPAVPSLSLPSAPISWATARHDARAAREAGDFVAYRRLLEALYERSGSPWVLVDLARADVLLKDVPGALGRLDAFAKTGMTYDVAADPKLAAVAADPSFSSLRTRLAANEQPIAHAKPSFALPQEELVTEDIAYDTPSQTFFVSSVRHRKILAIGPDGRARDLVPESPSASSILGLALAGGRLWATTAAMPPMVGYDPHAPHPTALLAFDPHEGSLLQRVELEAGPGEHALTDLAVGPTGAVFVSDSPGTAVYVLAPGATTLTLLAGPEELVSPQTPAPTADGKRLFVPDYVRGIATLDLATRKLEWLTHPADVTLVGIDGFYLDGKDLLAVQNGAAPPRVARFTLSEDGWAIVRAEVLERATPNLGEPTHGVLAAGAFYFLANAGWNRFDDDGHHVPNAPADLPAIWRLPR